GGQNSTAAANGDSAPQQIAYSTTLYDFPSAGDADAWMSGLDDRLATDPLRGYLTFALAADAPVYGDASAAYAFQRRTGDTTVAGFRVYARVGSEIAQVEYASAPESTLAEVEQLVNAQLDCLRSGACPSPAPIPTANGSGRGESGGRTHEPGERKRGGVRDISAPGQETPAAEAPPAEPQAIETPSVEPPAIETPEPEEIAPTAAPRRGGVRDISDQS
ncbi:MAG: hypothetical protein IT337_07245, partial [Thermomicrobiales bacterium]|nr:hypothetical protein [Thermomicrobiales bacterium]